MMNHGTLTIFLNQEFSVFSNPIGTPTTLKIEKKSGADHKRMTSNYRYENPRFLKPPQT
jgi:hypothetical protein